MKVMTLEYWFDGGWHIGRFREFPEAASQGLTLDELEENVHQMYELLSGDEEIFAINHIFMGEAGAENFFLN